jgi:hypothetical protein
MDIKSFGCSFIYGSELADDKGTRSDPSQLTWPALLSKQSDYGYQCYAQPGIGNLQIAEQVLNQSTDFALYIIGWTWIDRFDYVDSKDNQWVTILPVNTDSIATTYYKNMHSEYRDKLTTLMNIRLVIDTLQQKGYPFIMTFMDNLAFDTRWHTNTAILELQDYVRPHMTCFDGMNFLDWSKEQGYPIGTAAHPLEQAHAAAAEYMLQLGIHKV